MGSAAAAADEPPPGADGWVRALGFLPRDRLIAPSVCKKWKQFAAEASPTGSSPRLLFESRAIFEHCFGGDGGWKGLLVGGLPVARHGGRWASLDMLQALFGAPDHMGHVLAGAVEADRVHVVRELLKSVADPWRLPPTLMNLVVHASDDVNEVITNTILRLWGGKSSGLHLPLPRK